MDLDIVGLSRLQFAITALYHFLFVPLTLGLSMLIAIMETVYVMTRRVIWRQMTKFWGTLFGIKAFAVAILGGITSAWGVMLAGLAYGLIEALVTAFAGSVYTQIVAFSVVIVALALMPNGLLGRAAVNKV